MSKLIIGLLIIVLFVLFFLIFWIVVLSAALLIFGRKGQRKESLLTENRGTV
jgi:predicted membrane protein